MAETAVLIGNDIKELSSLKKFDEFIKLAYFHHVEKCENTYV